MAKWAVCLATIRPDLANVWLSKWHDLFSKHDVDVYIIQDTDHKTLMERDNVRVFDHTDVTKDLGKLASAIPRKTGACRSYAMLQAYRQGYDFYLSLDDDCFPVVKEADSWSCSHHDIFLSYENAFKPKHWPHYRYFDVASSMGYPYHLRGYPYGIRKARDVAAQYGIWLKIPDYDAITTIDKGIKEEMHIKGKVEAVPKFSGFTGCIMNVAISHKYLPIMYQLLMGDVVGYDRFDDIWSGLLLKKIADHFEDVVLINGYSQIHHDRASNPYKTLMQELPGMAKNETLWDELLEIKLTGKTPIDCYEELADSNVLPDQGKAMKTWTQIIKQQSSPS